MFHWSWHMHGQYDPIPPWHALKHAHPNPLHTKQYSTAYWHQNGGSSNQYSKGSGLRHKHAMQTCQGTCEVTSYMPTSLTISHRGPVHHAPCPLPTLGRGADQLRGAEGAVAWQMCLWNSRSEYTVALRRNHADASKRSGTWGGGGGILSLRLPGCGSLRVRSIASANYNATPPVRRAPGRQK